MAPPGQVEAAIVQPPLQLTKSIDQWQAVLAQVRAMPGIRVATPVSSGPVLVVRGSRRLSGADILIGTELSSDLGVDVGDKLHVTSASGASNLLKVVGVFDLGNKGANQRCTFTALRMAQSLLDMPGGATSIEVTVAFGIASVLVMVVQKSREIGILRAMGISRGQILRLFLLQGGLLGLAGAMVGCCIGAVALVLWQRLARRAARSGGGYPWLT